MNLTNNKWVGALALLAIITLAVFFGNLATDKYMEKKALGGTTAAN